MEALRERHQRLGRKWPLRQCAGGNRLNLWMNPAEAWGQWGCRIRLRMPDVQLLRASMRGAGKAPNASLEGASGASIRPAIQSD